MFLLALGMPLHQSSYLCRAVDSLNLGLIFYFILADYLLYRDGVHLVSSLARISRLYWFVYLPTYGGLARLLNPRQCCTCMLPARGMRTRRFGPKVEDSDARGIYNGHSGRPSRACH